MADAEQPAVDQGVVDGSGDGIEVVAEQGEGVAEHFPVAQMAGEEDRAAAAVEHVEGGPEVRQVQVVGPGGVIERARGVQHFDGKLHEVLEALFGDAVDGGLIPGRKGQADALACAVAMAFIDGVQAAAELGGGAQIGVHRERGQRRGSAARREVLRPCGDRAGVARHASERSLSLMVTNQRQEAVLVEDGDIPLMGVVDQFLIRLIRARSAPRAGG